MKTLIYTFVMVFLAGCVSTQGVIDEQLGHQIPDGAELAVLHTDMNPEQLFHAVRQSLVRQGHRLSNTDPEALSITTEGTDVGESTLARFNLYIEGGAVYGRAEWMPGMEAAGMAGAISGMMIDGRWEKADWTTGRPKRAFGSLVGNMSQIADGQFSFDP